MIVVIGILAIGIINIVNPIAQLQKARDAQRKSDLSQIQKAFETFHQDNGKYPDAENYNIKGLDGSIVDWGNPWVPYMIVLPKDPSSSKNYIYKVSSDWQTYYIYASLDRGANDPQVCNNGEACSNLPTGASCGTGAICNYGVSSQNVSP